MDTIWPLQLEQKLGIRENNKQLDKIPTRTLESFGDNRGYVKSPSRGCLGPSRFSQRSVGILPNCLVLLWDIAFLPSVIFSV